MDVAEMLHIGGGFLAALDNYVQAVVQTAPEAHAEGVRTFQADIQRRASLHPRWAPLADHIEAWSDDSRVHVGVRHPEKIEAAQNAEYGDAGASPVPLLRHTPGSAQKAADHMDDVLHARLGIPRYR
jgi:hypothetical protein